MARYAAPRHLEADELLIQPFEVLAQQRGLPNKARLFGEMDREANTGLQRARLRIEFVAVKTHPGLQAQGIACSEPDRRGPGCDQPPPDERRVI